MGNTKGREQNDAQPLGQRDGSVTRAGAKKTGKESAKRAGPDGPDAKEIGDTFKR